MKTMIELHFAIQASPSPRCEGTSRYVIEDHAFDFSPRDAIKPRALGAHTSLVVGTLQLEVDIESSTCLYLWGYCPRGLWTKSSLTAPTSRFGLLKVVTSARLQPGVSVGLEGTVESKLQFDPISGWFCMGRPNVGSECRSVEFASGCLAVVENEELRALWIRPVNFKELAN